MNDWKQVALAFLRGTDQMPHLGESDIAENKLIHHRIKFDTNEIMSIAPELAEFILEDPNHGEFEFGEIIQNELLGLHEKYIHVCVKVELVSLPRGYGGVIKSHKHLPPLSILSDPFMLQGMYTYKFKARTKPEGISLHDRKIFILIVIIFINFISSKPILEITEASKTIK